METYYLVQEIDGSEFNIYSGTEKECNDEMLRINNILGEKTYPMYVSINRFN